MTIHHSLLEPFTTRRRRGGILNEYEEKQYTNIRRIIESSFNNSEIENFKQNITISKQNQLISTNLN